MIGGGRGPRLPGTFWILWTGYLANRLGLLAPAFLALYLSGEHVMSNAQVGVAIAALGTGAVAGGLIGGLIADRAGARRTLWVSQLLASVASLALMVTRQPTLVIVLALVSGTLIGFPRSASFGLTAQMIVPALRVRAYGQLYWANSLGNSVSALLSGFLLHLWPPSLFLPSAVGAAVYAVIALTLPEVRQPDPPVAPGALPRPAVRLAGTDPADQPAKRWGRGLLMDACRPFTSRCVGPFLLLTFILSCVYMQRQSAMPLDMHGKGLSYTQLGALLSFSAILVVVVQPFAGHFTSRIRPSRILALSATLIGVGFGLNLFAAKPAVYAVGVTIWTMGEILMVPMAAAFIADHAPAGCGSTFQGAYALVWTLGLAVGAPAGQFLLTTVGAAPLWSAALVIGLGVALAHLALGRRCGWLATQLRHRQVTLAKESRSDRTA